MNSFRRLSPTEQEAWRAIVEFCGHITSGADVDVLRHGLSGSDYEVLVRLAEAGSVGIRMSELAALVLVSKSRLTYRIDRMERRGLVYRRVCESDRRGFIAEITEHGRTLLAEAELDHVLGVRARLVDRLGADGFTELATLAAKVVGRDLDGVASAPRAKSSA